MRSLPQRVQFYIYGLIVLAILLSVWSMAFVDVDLPFALSLIVFTFAIFVADLYPIGLPFEDNAEVTVSGTIKAAAAILFGPGFTILVTLLGTLMAEMALRRTWYKAAFNASEMAITSAAISFTYSALSDSSDSPFHSVQNGFAVMGMVVAFLVVNVGLVSCIVSLTTGADFWHIWKTNLQDQIWNNITLIPLGAVMAALWQYRPWAVFALVLPMVIVRQSFSHLADLQRQTRHALMSMADAIDQRDPSTYQHSRRVAQIAEAIANQLDLPYEEIRVLRTAARLHDLGKIGMSNTLLFKPGKFTDEEVDEFRKHPVIGAELVRSFHSFADGQSLILHHHERYDGKGYPHGVAGEDIPLGSRILNVADSVDAMTSRRSYRTRITLRDAVEEVLRNNGTQFDPLVVDAFLEIIRHPKSQLPWPDDELAECRQFIAQVTSVAPSSMTT